ncbi:hypothetical protein GCM10025864_09770 [Luteimicrobium album]|uniref:Alkaline shock response membrane anchor protein AmaP n=1 Tax=Luteimicrobium album TaxID=1054550 RepID=A0ABQ6HXH5_9MICO|nr:hypothetical protein [Luteimicrobium album]GMA23218.1 hypothetical protein GCM10025864_09770 [Luteimicrobium album]
MVVLDRVIGVVVGVALVAAGILLVGLGSGWVQDRWPQIPDVASTSRVVGWSEEEWWPWALAGGALVVAALAAWWLLAHRPASRLGAVTLSGGVTGTRLRVATDGVLAAACQVIERDPQVRSASLALAREREGVVVTGRVRVDPGAAIDAVARHVAEALDELAAVTGLDDLAGRVHIAVGGGATARRVG